MHFHYSLVSWGSVFAGAAIAVVTGAMLTLLGTGLGAIAAEPGDPSGASAQGLTMFGGLWLAISSVIGLLVGGYVAARAAANPDHHDGRLHGAAVWAVSFLLALFLTGSFVSGTAMSAIQAAGNAAESVRDPGAAASAAGNAAGAARDQTAADTAAERRAEEAGDRAADAAATGALWAFFTMAAGLIAAMIGGAFGARGDHGHRPRREYGSSDLI